MSNSTYQLIDPATVATALEVKNPMQTPKLTRAVVNIGVGKLEKERREQVAKMLTAITGRRPVATLAHKSIAAFKIREGNVVGYKVTLRGETMRRFVQKLVKVVLPRTRDFSGIHLKSVTSDGNLNLGIRDIGIFPEVRPEELVQNISLQVIISSTAKGESVEPFYRLIGFPLEK